MLLDKPRPGLLPDPYMVKAELLESQSWQNWWSRGNGSNAHA
jgi:hypothetical protein